MDKEKVTQHAAEIMARIETSGFSTEEQMMIALLVTMGTIELVHERDPSASIMDLAVKHSMKVAILSKDLSNDEETDILGNKKIE